MPWQLAAGEMDGDAVIVILQRGLDTWAPFSMVRLNVVGERIDGIRDYNHCPWVISTAASVTVAPPT